jgi:hypothetical protein
LRPVNVRITSEDFAGVWPNLYTTRLGEQIPSCLSCGSIRFPTLLLKSQHWPIARQRTNFQGVDQSRKTKDSPLRSIVGDSRQMILRNHSPPDRRRIRTGIRSNGSLRVKRNRIARYTTVPPGRRTVDHAIVRRDSVPAPDSHNRDSKIVVR